MEKKTIDVKDDYLMFQLVMNAKSHLHAIITYMQLNTPYGDEYKKAFADYEKVCKGLGNLEGSLADCAKLIAKSKHTIHDDGE